MASLNHLSSVLVVEDEAIILLDLESSLLDAGVADVQTATTVAEAMALIDATRFDAAVLDLHLGPEAWTYDIAHRLRSANIPFVLSSGTIDVVEEFREVPLISKPYKSDELILALQQITMALPVASAS